MKYVYGIITLIIVLQSALYAQNGGKEPGMYWGVNVEMYFGNRHDALYYNGAFSRPVSLNDVVGQQQTSEDISEYLNSNFSLEQVPGRFIYDPAIGVGLNLQYYTSPTISFYTNLDILLLNSYGVFVLDLTETSTDPSSYSNTEKGTISASEKRFNVSGGMHILFPIEKMFTPYLDVGFIASLLQTDSHKMEIGPVKRNMYFSTNYVNEGAIYSTFGYGPQIGAGIQFPLSDYYVFTGGQIDFINYNLIETGFNANYSIIARIMF
ncbi:MAG: hypothetical protein R6U95_07750 [Bacteroidales bacterium]